MAKLTLYVDSLKASKEDRTLSGLLLPFEEVGYTNLGKLTASKDSVLTIADAVVLNVQHDRDQPVGKALALNASNEGIRASFKILETRAGDDALIEYEEGVRCGLSIEIEPIVTKAGKIVSGTITGAALVTEPAFKSARLAAEAAQDVPDLGNAPEPQTPDVFIDGSQLDNVKDVAVSDEKIEITTEKAPEKAPDDDTQKDGSMAASATVTNPALAAAGGSKKKTDKNALFAAFAAAAAGQPGRMEAALSDIVPANILGLEQPQYIGELWDGVPYERRFLPLFRSQPLTSWEVKGWEWVNEPTVDLYTGNKTPIPSGSISTQEKSGVLQRIAGGHDIDRKFRDFGNAEFWDAYFTKMAESYARVSDTYIRNLIREIPTTANGGRVHLLTGAAPAGVPTALWQIVEGCVKIMDNLDTLPNFALVTTDFWKPLLYTKMQDVLVYLNAALNMKDGTLENGGFKIIPVKAGSLTATGGGGFTGKVLVGHKDALSVRELPGSPIRVEAIDVAKGGIDEALFGYVGTMVEAADGFALFDTPTAS